MAVADGSSTTASALALVTAVVVLVTAAVNAYVAVHTAKQGKETRDALLNSAKGTDQVLAGVTASVVDLSKSIDQRFTTAQAQMSKLLDALESLVDRLFPDHP